MSGAETFYAFWIEYLNGHQALATRLWHFVGISAGIIALLLGLISWNWIYVVVAIIIAYGFSFIGHFMVERNRPLSFRHPVWSARAGVLLYRLMLTRGLTEKINTFKLL